jgi:hypothetical protein
MRAWTSAFVAFVVLAQPHTARGHLGHLVQQAERYVKIDVSGFRVRLVVSLTLGARETARLMEQADSDRNGWVSPEERDEYMALWGDGLRSELEVQVDGQPVDVRYGEPFMQPIGPIAAVAGSVEMVGEFLLDGGEQRITVGDGMPLQPFDRTDFSFRARDGAALLASGIGTTPVTPTEHASLHRGAAYPASFSMHVRVPQRPKSASERLVLAAPWAAGTAAALALVVAIRAFRRQWLRRATPR